MPTMQLGQSINSRFGVFKGANPRQCLAEENALDDSINVEHGYLQGVDLVGATGGDKPHFY